MTEQTLDRPFQGGHILSPVPATTLGDSDTADSTSFAASGLPAEGEVEPGHVPAAWGATSANEDFEYIPVSPWAPIALSLGLFGLTGFLGIFGLYVAFFGIFIGIAAVARIRASAGVVKGTSLAAAGLLLSIASFVLGSARMAHAYSTEVPDGFQRVNFPKDVAEKQFVYIGGRRQLHPDVAPLIEKKVYLKGFMWATQDTEGLAQFILLKDNGECCFGGKPKSHDYVWIKLPRFNQGERPQLSYRSSAMSVKELTEEEKVLLEVPRDFQLTTRAFLGMVAVAGVLHADVNSGEKGSSEDYEYAPVYSMDAELVEEAWTRF